MFWAKYTGFVVNCHIIKIQNTDPKSVKPMKEESKVRKEALFSNDATDAHKKNSTLPPFWDAMQLNSDASQMDRYEN